jgi:2-iminobutanoate/2-iminopropanoate deaminase
MDTYKRIDGVPTPVGPYSPATRVGNLVFLAGQIALHPENGKLVEGGIEVQMRQVMENLTAALGGVGSSWSRVCMTTVFLTAISDGPVVSGVYEHYLDKDRMPARQTVAVRELPLGALVEVSLIAEVD